MKTTPPVRLPASVQHRRPIGHEDSTLTFINTLSRISWLLVSKIKLKNDFSNAGGVNDADLPAVHALIDHEAQICILRTHDALGELLSTIQVTGPHHKAPHAYLTSSRIADVTAPHTSSTNTGF